MNPDGGAGNAAHVEVKTRDKSSAPSSPIRVRCNLSAFAVIIPTPSLPGHSRPVSRSLRFRQIMGCPVTGYQDVGICVVDMVYPSPHMTRTPSLWWISAMWSMSMGYSKSI